MRLTVLVPFAIRKQLSTGWHQHGYDSESAFVRAAIREKLQRSDFEKRLEERLYASLSEQNKRLRGLQSMLRLDFSALSTFFKVFLLYFREPTGDVLKDNTLHLEPRMQAYIRSVVEQYHGESGNLFDDVTEEKEEQAIAATGD